MIAIAYLLLYCYGVFITYLWSNNHKKNIGNIIRQPMIYTKLSKFEWSNFGFYIVVPLFFVLIMTMISVPLLSAFGGFEKVGRTWQLKPLPFSSLLFLPSLIGLGFIYHSSKFVLCVVCKGKGKLHGHNDLIDADFNRETCFCCNGKGKIALNTAFGDSHKVLEQNVETMRIQEDLLHKFDKDLNRINSKISNNINSPTLLDLQKRVEAKYNFHKETFDFYDLAVRKMCLSIYDKSLHATHMNDDTEYGKQLGDTMVASERVKDHTADLAFEMNVMNEKMKMNDYSPESINDLKSEIAKIKADLA